MNSNSKPKTSFFPRLTQVEIHNIDTYKNEVEFTVSSTIIKNQSIALCVPVVPDKDSFTSSNGNPEYDVDINYDILVVEKDAVAKVLDYDGVTINVGDLVRLDINQIHSLNSAINEIMLDEFNKNVNSIIYELRESAAESEYDLKFWG